MTDIGPASNSSDPFGLASLAPDPILISGLPRYQTQVANQLLPTSPLAPLLEASNPQVAQAFKDYQNQRVAQGSAPWGTTDAQQALLAANAHQNVTAPPEQSILGNAVSDVSTIAHGLNPFKLVPQVAHEVVGALDMPGEATAALSKARNPIESVGNLAQLPGIRLIPGSGIASNLATGGPGLVSGIEEHPVMSALDVLPYASKLAETSKVVELAGDLNEANRASQVAAGVLPESSRLPPIRTFMRNYSPFSEPTITSTETPVMAWDSELGQAVPKVDELGNPVTVTNQSLTPNSYGQLVSNMKASFDRTALGQLVQAGGGTEARNMAQIVNQQTNYFNQITEHPELASDPVDRALADISSTARAARASYSLTPQQTADLQSIWVNGTPDQQALLSTLTPEEQAAHASLEAITQSRADQALAMGDLKAVLYKDRVTGEDYSELLLPKAADRINAARDAATAAVQPLLDEYNGMYEHPLGGPVHVNDIPGHQRLYDEYNATVDDLANKGYLNQAQYDQFMQEGIELREGFTHQIDAQRGRYFVYQNDAAVQSALTDLNTHIANQDWTAAATDVKFLRSLSETRAQNVDYAAAARELNAAAKVEASFQNLPARWTELIRNQVQAQILEQAKASVAAGILPEADFDRVAQAIAHRAYSAAGFAPADIEALTREIAATWQDLKAQGYDPHYMYNTSPERAARAVSGAKPLDFEAKANSLKDRQILNSAPGQNDPFIALSAEANDYLNKRVMSRMLEEQVIPQWARTGADLYNQLRDRLTETMIANPLRDEKSALSALIADEGLVPLDITRKGGSFMGTPSELSPETQLYVPREVAKVLDGFANPQLSEVGRLTQAPMKLFRKFLFDLSPTHYLHVGLGSQIMAMGRMDRPFANLLKFGRDAYEAALHPEIPRDFTIGGETHTLTPALLESEGQSLPPINRKLQATSEYGEQATKLAADPTHSLAHNIKMAQTFKRWFEDSSASGLTDTAGIQAARRSNQHLVDFHTKFVSVAHGFTEMLSYFDHADEAMRAGTPFEEASRIGMEQARATMDTWSRMTPLERQITRTIFPFYGFTRNMLSYVMRYPADEPLRMAILANLARAEQTDFGTGLPEKFQKLLWLGPTDSDGNVKAVNVDWANPFRDVASYASLPSLLFGGEGDLSAVTKNLNPLVSTGLKELGVDPAKGQAGLYPDIYYNPNTGDLGAKTGNPVLDLVNGIAPQSQVFSDLFGLNQQYRSLLRTNPDAAAAMLTSDLRLPQAPTTYNLPQERMKQEVVKYKQEQTDLKNALATGDYSLAEQWPGLRRTMALIRAMTPEQRAAFTPTDTTDTSPLNMLEHAVTRAPVRQVG